MKGAAALLIISIIFLFGLTPGLVASHMMDGSELPLVFKGFDPKNKVRYHPMVNGPGFTMKGENRAMPFMMGPKEVTFQRGNENVTHFLSRDQWSINLDFENRSMSYDSEINESSFGSFNISIDISPSNDGSRRIYYNLSLEGEIDMDKVFIKWGFGFQDPEEGPRLHDDINWRKQRENLILNDTEGRPLMNVNMYKHARIRDSSGYRTEAILVESSINEKNGTISAVLDVGGKVEQLETSGYIEILKELIEIIENGTEEASRFIREHWISISIGSISMMIISLLILGFMKRKTINEDPQNELDYEKSRYFKGPRGQ